MTKPVESPPWTLPSPPSGPIIDPEAYALETAVRSLILLGAATSPRSLQQSIGSSEIGHVCDRRIAYRLAGTPASNLTDPLRSLVGVGWHAAMADMFTRLDGGSGRFLVEHHVKYRDVPGTIDLFDRALHTLFDWKSTLKSKLTAIRHNGPPTPYVVQTQTYGAGLEAQGEDVRHVALVFVPVDADLDGLYVWRTRYDRAVADAAIDRVDKLRGRLPSTVPQTPDEMCGWCDQFRPGATDLNTACPGHTQNQRGTSNDSTARMVQSGPATNVQSA